MKYKDFIGNLEVHRTISGKGNGVRCNFALYMYPDGHSNFYCLDDHGDWVKHRDKDVTSPANDELETMDILYSMRKKARRIR